MDYLGFLQELTLVGALTLVVLFGLSISMVAVGWEIRERIARVRLDGDWLFAQVRYLLFVAQKPEAVSSYLANLDRPLARIFRELFEPRPADLDQADYLLTSLIARERLRLEPGLSWLGTIAVISPFVGLFGTVVGITKTFADIAESGQAGIAVVSAGVSEALVATALGLLVAIVSVVLFNNFRARITEEVGSWQTAAQLLASLLCEEQETAKQRWSNQLAEVSTESAQKYLDSLN